MTDAELIAWFKVQTATAKLAGEKTFFCKNELRERLYKIAGLQKAFSSYAPHKELIATVHALTVLNRIEP